MQLPMSGQFDIGCSKTSSKLVITSFITTSSKSFIPLSITFHNTKAISPSSNNEMLQCQKLRPIPFAMFSNQHLGQVGGKF